MRQRHLIVAFLIAPLAASPGCDWGNTVWITGKLLKGGTQYVPPKDQLVTVVFVALQTRDESGKTIKSGEQYQAEYDPATGNFTVPGPERRGIPPGKYRVAVTQRLTRNAFAALKTRPKGVTRETDTLDSRYGMDTSPFIVTAETSKDFTIDLDHPTEQGPSH